MKKISNMCRRKRQPGRCNYINDPVIPEAEKGRLSAKGHIRDAQEEMKSWLAVQELCDLSVAACSMDVRSRQEHCWQTSIRFQGWNAQIEDSSLAKEVS